MCKLVKLLATKALIFLACVSVSGVLAGVVRGKGVLSQVCKMVEILATNSLIYIALVAVAGVLAGVVIKMRTVASV